MTITKAIEAMKFYKQRLYNGVFNQYIDAFDVAVSALEKQVPKKPIHRHEEYPKHQWQKDDDGNIDECAFLEQYHTGVRCERCRKTVCALCNPNYDEDKCITDFYLCPTCNEKLSKYDSPNGCKSCLQRLDWSDVE